MAGKPAIDELDRRIIAELQADGRRPFTEIARNLGTTEATVRQRVQRMQRRGVVQIVAVVAPLKLGLRRVLIGVRVRGRAPASVEERLRGMADIDYVALTAGNYDLILMAACADDGQLTELVTERLRVIPGVDAIDVVTILRETKDAYQYAEDDGELDRR